MSDILDGLLLLSPEVFLFMVAGILVGTLVATTPGLGGLLATAIILPFALSLDPVAGIALVLGATVVGGTGNVLTSVLFGVPGSPGGVASMIDGRPLARRGQGVMAVSAALTASMLGGFIGAVALALSLPVLRPLVLAFRPPEFFALILLAMVFMAFVGRQDPLKGLISGGVGLLLSFVGMEQSTGTQRFTFGELYLWEGIPLVPLMLGLFAISEMMSLARKGTSLSNPKEGSNLRQMREGILAPLRKWPATVQSSIAGLWVGLAPGLGDAAAQFAGYGQVARTSKRRKYFGTGEIEGVIAADAATNSKEGGALIPTLALGIPGSASMAIVIAAFLAFDITPGPAMLTDNVDIVWMIIWILILANVITTSICLGITPLLVRLTELRASLIVPPILLISIYGAYSANHNVYDVVVLLVLGFVGWFMKEHGYSRAVLIIGFVLGTLLEQNYLLSVRIFGPEFLLRPITLILISLIALVVLSPVFSRIYRAFRPPKAKGQDLEGSRSGERDDSGTGAASS